MTAELCFLPDPEAVSLKAALIFTAQAIKAVASKGRFTVAVSGGSTPLGLYRLLGATSKKDIPWDRTYIFWVDERCVAPDHQDSNYEGVYGALISRVDIPAANIHRIKGEMPPEAGAREYEEELKRYFGSTGLPVFDLVILGVGEDGHTASLFPNDPSLAERERLAIPVYVKRMHSRRITLTLPVLNNALSILFLVTGSKKAGILKGIFDSREKSQKFPSSLIQPVHGEVTWLIDTEAAVKLRADVSEKRRIC